MSLILAKLVDTLLMKYCINTQSKVIIEENSYIFIKLKLRVYYKLFRNSQDDALFLNSCILGAVIV